MGRGGVESGEDSNDRRNYADEIHLDERPFFATMSGVERAANDKRFCRQDMR